MTNISDDHHVIRNAPWSKLRRDADDNVLGVTGEAFRMRDAEDTLSATWLEYFPGDRWSAICAAVKIMRASKLDIKSKSGFAIGNVGRIKANCESKRHQIRIVHEPEPDNPAHAAVRRYPRDNFELFELLANDAWSEVVRNKDVP